MESLEPNKVMLRTLVHKVVDEKLRSVRLKSQLLRKIEDATSSLRNLANLSESMLENQDLISPVLAIVKKELNKDVDVELKSYE